MRTKGAAFLLCLGLVGCDGNHSLGITSDDLTTKCCYDQGSNVKVSACTGANCKCDPSLCKEGSACKVATDCPQLGIACQQCPDGSTSCPKVDCVNGQCVGSVPACGAPSCTSDKDCLLPALCELCGDGSCRPYTATCVKNQCVIDKGQCSNTTQCNTTPQACPATACLIACKYYVKDPNGCDTCQCADAMQPPPPTRTGVTCAPPPDSCVLCADGSKQCAQTTCVNGLCKVFYPTCPPPTGGCKSDAECLKPGAPCQVCPDGSSACPKSWCDLPSGTCQGSFPGCPPPKCQPVVCNLACPFGYATDSNGCQICQCLPGQTDFNCKADSDCTTWAGCGNTCMCTALSRNQAPPLCDQTPCFPDPCAGQTPYCRLVPGAAGGTCALRPTP
jgi:hypothetical protein